MSCPAYCRCARVSCGTAVSVPEGTVRLEVRVLDVREGDWLDFRSTGPDERVQGVVHAFTDAKRIGKSLSYALNLTGTFQITVRGDQNVTVWRPTANLKGDRDPRPIDLRTDLPARTLTDAHRLGRCGLAQTFLIGSVWEVGPFIWDRDPQVVRITGEPFTQGTNCSKQPEDAEALGKPTWFLPTETLYWPFKSPPAPRKAGSREGQPPGVLAALTPEMAAKAGLACCDCATYVSPCNARILSCNAGVVQSMRATEDKLLQTISEQQDEVMRLHALLEAEKSELSKAKDDFAKISRAVYAANESLRGARAIATDNLRAK